MASTMQALVYEAPYQMHLREVPVPSFQADQVLIKVAFSGICGSELSGFEGKNALRKPPLIMGHEFAGVIADLGETAQTRFPDLKVGSRVTVNPLVTCGVCDHCITGRHSLCAKRMLHSASLPGSNAQYIAVRAENIVPVPDDMPLEIAALTEPAACGVHAARFANPAPHEVGLVIGAGPIGLLALEALQERGMTNIYCADLNAERLAMAEALGATSVKLDDSLRQSMDVVIDAVGAPMTCQSAVMVTKSGGRIVWLGLHEPQVSLDINDVVRREITCFGSFGYNPIDFRNALHSLHAGRLHLDRNWTSVEPLADGTRHFDALLHGAAVAKIWLQPPQ